MVTTKTNLYLDVANIFYGCTSSKNKTPFNLIVPSHRAPDPLHPSKTFCSLKSRVTFPDLCRRSESNLTLYLTKDYKKKEKNTHNTSTCDILKNKPKLNLNVCACIIFCFAQKKDFFVKVM